MPLNLRSWILIQQQTVTNNRWDVQEVSYTTFYVEYNTLSFRQNFDKKVVENLAIYIYLLYQILGLNGIKLFVTIDIIMLLACARGFVHTI